jgi:hypothetical protein
MLPCCSRSRCSINTASYPYGVAIEASGETHLAAGDPGEQRPPSQSVLNISPSDLRCRREMPEGHC